jgi:hypothetical protein
LTEARESAERISYTPYIEIVDHKIVNHKKGAKNMKSVSLFMMSVVVLLSCVLPAQAGVTVYLKDGTQFEVESVTRMGDMVCLLIDISEIDTARTPIEELAVGDESSPKTPPQPGLRVTDVKFEPSEDNLDILATGTVHNATQRQVTDIQVVVTLMDKEDRVLLTINGSVRPFTLEPGQSGSYAFRVRKPEGFWKANVNVKADMSQSPAN